MREFFYGFSLLSDGAKYCIVLMVIFAIALLIAAIYCSIHEND